MLSLVRYIYLFEGGQAGHMPHPFDYTDFTGNDLLDIVDSLFAGKIENMKEKLDGFNIFATMNNDGEVVFIRNKSNLNSEKGGMSIDDMMAKWASAEHQKTVFRLAGETITDIFKNFDIKFFNPDPETKKCINCECIIQGKTNNIVYAADRVAFHGYQIYKLKNGKWELDKDVEGHVDDIYKAAEGMDKAKPRPNLVIRSAEQAIKFADKFKQAITKAFSDEGFGLETSIEDWKLKRFKDIKPVWMTEKVEAIFGRWFNADNSVNAREFKNIYNADQYSMIVSDKDKRRDDYIEKVMQPLDNLFLSIGNEMIDLCDGFVNAGINDKVIAQLKADMEETIEAVKNSDSDKMKIKLEKSLNRLKMLGDRYNSAEGIVFMYKGRRMKLTGSFAPINQVLGLKYKL